MKQTFRLKKSNQMVVGKEYIVNDHAACEHCFVTGTRVIIEKVIAVSAIVVPANRSRGHQRVNKTMLHMYQLDSIE